MSRPTPNLGTDGDVLGARTVAFAIDAVVLLAVGGVLAGALATLDPTTTLLATPLLGVGVVGYFVGSEALHGQTLGKRLVGLVVVDGDGGHCGWRASFLRNCLRVVDGAPGCYLVGLAAIFLTDGRRLGDLAADTVVVETAD
jgi:uncharacterized RDD family membrane protein YckC